MTPPLRYATYGGMTAILAGSVDNLAFEFVGPEVAVKAVVAALLSIHHRAADKTPVRVDDRPFHLEQVNFRVVSAPLGDGAVSCVLLHPLAVLSGVAESTTTRRRRRNGTEDETTRGTVSQFAFIHRAAPGSSDRAPDGFARAFASVLPLPFRAEWADALYTAGGEAGLIRTLTAVGSLAGLTITLDAAAWHPTLGAIARAAHARPEAAARPRGRPGRSRAN